MLTEFLKKKLSDNFIFDGLILLFVNFFLLFSFGILFSLFILLNTFFSRHVIKALVSPSALIVFFSLISIWVWFVFGKETYRAFGQHKLIKILIVNLIGSAPVVLVFIYENLLIGLRETRSSSGCVGGLIAFSVSAIGALIFQSAVLLGGAAWSSIGTGNRNEAK